MYGLQKKCLTVVAFLAMAATAHADLWDDALTALGLSDAAVEYIDSERDEADTDITDLETDMYGLEDYYDEYEWSIGDAIAAANTAYSNGYDYGEGALYANAYAQYWYDEAINIKYSNPTLAASHLGDCIYWAGVSVSYHDDSLGYFFDDGDEYSVVSQIDIARATGKDYKDSKASKDAAETARSNYDSSLSDLAAAKTYYNALVADFTVKQGKGMWAPDVTAVTDYLADAKNNIDAADKALSDEKTVRSNLEGYFGDWKTTGYDTVSLGIIAANMDIAYPILNSATSSGSSNLYAAGALLGYADGILAYYP